MGLTAFNRQRRQQAQSPVNSNESPVIPDKPKKPTPTPKSEAPIEKSN